MLKLTKTGIGLLTRQYRAVLKKCFLINLGIFAATTVLTTEAYGAGYAGVKAGEDNTADGWYSIAFGYENASHGGYSSAVGYQNTTNGWVSSAYGIKNVAKGIWSAAFGNQSRAYGTSSFALGNYATAGVESDYISGNDAGTRTIDRYATAVGNFVQATGLYALAIGNQKDGMTQTMASGQSAIAIGTGAQATENNSVAIGTNSVSAGENTISVGSSSIQRQIKYVAAGTNDIDAVNYGQIKNFITASALNGYATTASLALASVNYANSAGSASFAQRIGGSTIGYGYDDGGSASWGTLTSGNGYYHRSDWTTSDGGGFSLADKGGQTSMQIDGLFYQNEGQYRVLDTSDIIYSVTSGSGKIVTSGAVASALSGKQATIDDLATIRSNATEGAAKVSANNATITITANGVTKTFDTNQGTAATLDFGSTDLSNYYTKLETYSKNEINNIQSLNNYYRNNKKSEILGNIFNYFLEYSL